MSDTLFANIEDQRLTAGTARVEAGKMLGSFRYEGVDVGTDSGLIDKGQLCEIGKTANIFRLETELRKKSAVIGNICLGVDE